MLALLPLPAWADWPARGQGRMRVFGFSVFDIRLLAPAPVQPERWAEQELALELRYRRALQGARIAERSLQEMRRQGEIAAPQAQAWLAALTATFPDVQEGDRITGHHHPEQGARFRFNGRPIGPAFDAEFSRRFFGIWLHPATSEPELRRQLFGGS